jgi:hypothetical protein
MITSCLKIDLHRVILLLQVTSTPLQALGGCQG